MGSFPASQGADSLVTDPSIFIVQALAPSGPPVQGYGPYQGVEARSGDGSQRAGSLRAGWF
jgi:hypothetical protein